MLKHVRLRRIFDSHHQFTGSTHIEIYHIWEVGQ